jgi:hypothetical protein
MVQKVDGTYGSKHADVQVGTYEGGKFRPYGHHYEVHAKIDEGSNQEVIRLAKSGRVIHGSYKDGNFRPADARGRAGYINHIDTPRGRCKFNYEGEVLDNSGQVVGALDKNGSLLGKEEYKRAVESDMEEAVRAMQDLPEPALTETYEAEQRVKADMYQDFVRIGKKVGVSEDKLRGYAKRLKLSDKEVRERTRKALGGLERGLLGVISGIGFFAGLFLASPNLTGNVISNSVQNSSGWIGAILLITGLVGTLFWVKKK